MCTSNQSSRDSLIHTDQESSFLVQIILYGRLINLFLIYVYIGGIGIKIYYALL
jgi:hypothetical protein